ncbi:hypothetical protein ACJIZ3_017921 [Penstemon smallii]|uniref:Thylakoid soluble phosphoprotein TSP9 n=1 Tax=Penstemon smallii TaxID=265156 RepID=A0ABD3SWX8_9LAMI
MSSLNLFLTPIVTPTNRRVKIAATAAKSSGGNSTSEEKGIVDFILGALTKQDQFYETDPILKKVEEEEKKTGTTGRSKNSVVVPPAKKKDGGFGLGGLFLKK